MILNQIAAVSVDFSYPPAGSVNVKRGKAITGPGGRWIPCATLTPSGDYVSGLFQVAPGSRQICVSNAPAPTADAALSTAVQLAVSVAG